MDVSTSLILRVIAWWILATTLAWVLSHVFF